eukprot:scaffold401030_cov36-Prasinocladus_malaysianus.AAC.1
MKLPRVRFSMLLWAVSPLPLFDVVPLLSSAGPEEPSTEGELTARDPWLSVFTEKRTSGGQSVFTHIQTEPGLHIRREFSCKECVTHSVFTYTQSWLKGLIISKCEISRKFHKVSCEGWARPYVEGQALATHYTRSSSGDTKRLLIHKLSGY